MKTIIMAGGKGTRIASIASDVPKPMIRICGKPILEHQIDNLKACGLTDITLVIGHLGNVIQDYFGDGSKFGVKIDYFVETEPLGTAGALFKMNLTDDFLLMCGDVIMDVDFNRFIRFHKEHGAWASLISHPNGHPYDSSLLVTETLPPAEKGGLPVDTHRVIRWMNKEEERTYYQNRVNAGIEIISPQLLRCVEDSRLSSLVSPLKKVDLDRDVLKPNIPSGRIYAYDTPEYIKDMGTPDRYYEVEHDIESGLVHARNLSVPQKAIFLDRDGTINKSAGFLTKPEQIELIEGAAEAIKMINKSGYLAIVVTNQPVIARGDVTWEELQTIHNKMETELGKQGAFVDAIYLCPHHPKSGFEGERPEYKHPCDCRKPKPGLLLRAAADYNIDLAQSYMIGDFVWDVQAGQAAGVKRAIKIETDKPDALLCAVREIMDNRMKKKLNYITFDSWWDTDATLLPELCKEYDINVFVEDYRETPKYLDKVDYGFKKFVKFKAKYRNRDIRRSWSSMKYFFSVMKETRKKDSTTLFILGGDAYIVMLLFFLLNPKRTIIASHNYREHVDNRRNVFAFVYRWYYHRFRRFLFFSELQKQDYLKDFPNKDVHSITMPLKDFGKPKGKRTDKRITFMFFGGIRPYKHPEVFINAAHKIPADKARFIMVGNAKKDTWCKYKKLVKDDDNIEYDIRFVDNSEIPDFFNQADFLVLPYEDATQSGPSLIALNYGVPLIATKLPAFESLIKNGENGYLFEPCNENVLAELFLEIIKKGRTDIDRMKAAMLRYKEEYKNNHNILDLFRSII